MKKFSQWLQVRGYRNKMYEYWVGRFFSKFNTLTTENLNSFIIDLQKQGKSKETINMFIKAMKLYSKFEGRTDVEFPPLHKTKRKLPHYITYEQFLKVIDLAEYLFDGNRKVILILWFMFLTGVRKGELYNLKRKDFDFEKNLIKIYADKTDEERWIPLPPTLEEVIKQYFSETKEKDNAFNLSKYEIDYIFKKINKYTKFRFHPHLLRHSFAVFMLSGKKKVDLEAVKTLLGHKNIQTTEIYVKRNIEDIQKIYNEKFKEIT